MAYMSDAELDRVTDDVRRAKGVMNEKTHELLTSALEELHDLRHLTRSIVSAGKLAGLIDSVESRRPNPPAATN